MGILRKYGKTGSEYETDKSLRVVQDISNIINSKAGFSFFDAQFGVRDLSNYTDTEQIADAAIEEIRRNIESYATNVEIISLTKQQSTTLSRISLLLECRVANDLERIKIYTEIGEPRWQVTE